MAISSIVSCLLVDFLGQFLVFLHAHYKHFLQGNINLIANETKALGKNLVIGFRKIRALCIASNLSEVIIT